MVQLFSGDVEYVAVNVLEHFLRIDKMEAHKFQFFYFKDFCN